MNREGPAQAGLLSCLAAKLARRGVPVLAVMVPGVSHVGLVNGFRAARFSPVLADSVAWIRARAAN
jgi:hypothetical protein